MYILYSLSCSSDNVLFLALCHNYFLKVNDILSIETIIKSWLFILHNSGA